MYPPMAGLKTSSLGSGRRSASAEEAWAACAALSVDQMSKNINPGRGCITVYGGLAFVLVRVIEKRSTGYGWLVGAHGCAPSRRHYVCVTSRAHSRAPLQAVPLSECLWTGIVLQASSLQSRLPSECARDVCTTMGMN